MAPPNKELSDRDRAGLSPEELEALGADPDDDEEHGDGDGDGGGGDVGTKDAPAAAPAAAAAKPDADDAPDAPAPAPEAARALASDLPTLPVPEAKDWDALEGGIVKKYEDGELSEAEYRKELRDLHIEQATASVTATMSEQFAETNWKRDATSFNDAHPEYSTSRSRHAALNAAMEAIEQETKGTLNGRELLERAHKAVIEDLGAPAAKAGTKPGTRPQPKEGDARRNANERTPTTLGDLPAADAAPDVGTDKWAVLDRLAETDGMAYERELAKLSESEQNAYLAAA